MLLPPAQVLGQSGRRCGLPNRGQPQELPLGGTLWSRLRMVATYTSPCWPSSAAHRRCNSTSTACRAAASWAARTSACAACASACATRAAGRTYESSPMGSSKGVSIHAPPLQRGEPYGKGTIRRSGSFNPRPTSSRRWSCNKCGSPAALAWCARKGMAALQCYRTV